VRIRLIKKLAGIIDGVDLNGKSVGETLEMSLSDASLLLAEGWAVPERRAGSGEQAREFVSSVSHSKQRMTAVVADEPSRRHRPRKHPTK